MPRNIFFFIKTLLISSVIVGNLYASEISIIPLKKPVLDKVTQVEKKSQDILKPKSKPSKKEKKIKTIIVKKDIKKINFLIPKSKPLIVKKSKSVIKERSKYFSQNDYNIAKKSIQAMEKSQWSTALSLSKKAKDKSIYNFIEWRHLLTTGNQASFYDYMAFIKDNEDYPRMGRIKYLAEHKLSTDKISPKKIINWFGPNDPLSGFGMLILGESYIQTGDVEKGISLIKEGWITAEVTRSNMKYFRSKYKKYLDSNDYINRADNLAWENKHWDLKRMLRYLPEDYRLLYTARQILMSNSYGVDNAILKVPTHLKNDPGLAYDRLRWRNRRGRLEGSLEILYDNANRTESQMIRPDKWWEQRKSVARSLIYKKRYKSAYKISSGHSMSAGSSFAEAEWLSGWIALSFLNSPEYAISHFENFYNNVSYPISLSRGAYWLGATYKKLGNSELSNKYFNEGAKFPMTYYGQLSFSEIKPGENFELIDQSNFDKEYEKEFKKNKLIKHVILLKELNATKYAKDILKHLATLNIEKGSEVLAAKLSTDVERYDFAIQISKQASYEKRFFNKYNYPIISTPKMINKKKMPNSEVVLAIIRQESEFDRKANSWAGARGMMQLMKPTAKLVAKQAKLPYSISGLTQDPEYNIKLGTFYFNSLIENYNGVYPFAIAAYNAGPNRVKTWRKVNGDPSKGQLSYVNWVELIRFKETRNYVQRVLENINVYKYMLNKEPVKIDNIFN